MNLPRSPSPASYVDFVLLAAIWGASFLFMRMGVVDFGVLPTAGLRVIVASLFLLPLVVWRGQWPALRAQAPLVFSIGTLNSAIPFVLFSFASQALSTGLLAILNATVPLFAALVAWAWLSDRPSGARAVGLAIGFWGVAMLASDKASFTPDSSGIAPGWAVLACLLATLCYALAATATKRYVVAMPSLAVAAGSQAGASIALVLPTLWTWPAVAPGWQAGLAILALGVVCTGTAYVLYFRLIERLGPARALSVTFVIPVFASLYGVLWLDEALTRSMLVWGAVILLGTALSSGLIGGRKPA